MKDRKPTRLEDIPARLVALEVLFATYVLANVPNREELKQATTKALREQAGQADSARVERVVDALERLFDIIAPEEGVGRHPPHA